MTRKLQNRAILQTLLQADREMSLLQAPDSYAFYALLHRTAASLMPVDAFYGCLYFPSDDTLFFPYNMDDGEYDEPVTMPLGNGPTSQVVRTGKPFVLKPQNRAIQNGNIDFGQIGRLSASALHVPMRDIDASGQEQIIGVLSAQSYTPRAYNATDVTTLQWLADRAAAKVQRDRQVAHHPSPHAATHAAERRQHAILLTDAFVQMLVGITAKAEALRPLASGDNPSLRKAIQELCRECYRRQTEANQLPLDLEHAPPRASDAPLPASLTERERDILELLAGGASNAAIASRLHLSVHTVKFHLKNIFTKIGVKNRTEAVRAYARTHRQRTDTSGSSR